MKTDISLWLDHYSEDCFNQIEGWVDKGSFNLLKLIDLWQSERNVKGGVCEIGVHHGLFFMAINALVQQATDVSIAVDLFEDQHLNIDFSGRGNLSRFKENLNRWDRHRGRNVKIISGDSTALARQHFDNVGASSFKIVSIDGGHTAEHTISDMDLAISIVHPFGFLIVDDILNSHWLGVIDGMTTYFRKKPTFWPIAIGFNKLILCHMSVHESVRQVFAANFQFTKTTKLCGYEILAV